MTDRNKLDTNMEDRKIRQAVFRAMKEGKNYIDIEVPSGAYYGLKTKDLIEKDNIIP